MFSRDVRDYAHRARVQRHLEPARAAAPDPDFVACLRDTIMGMDHRTGGTPKPPVAVTVDGIPVQVADLGLLTGTEAREAAASLLGAVGQESTLGHPRP